MFKRFIKDFWIDTKDVFNTISSSEFTSRFVKGLLKLILIVLLPLLFIIDFLLFPIREYRDKRRK